ncbi:MAG: cohesin domain-containing protein [Patescibacteria group bacterium]
MKLLNKKFIIFIAVTASIVLFGKTASAATLYMNPKEQTVFADETFLAEVYLDSEKEIINAVQTQITYPTNYFEVVDLAFGDSLLTIWPEQPTDKPETGIISFTGGVPVGSYVFDSKILTITFRAKRTGTATINFVSDTTSVHLSDGQGTPVNTNTTASNVTIITPSSQAISISSPTHPNQDRWYPVNDFTVTWEPRIDSFYSYLISSDPKAEPDQTQELAVGEVTFDDLADGIYYFILYEKPSGETWQYAGKRRVMIDQTPPLPFNIKSVDGIKEFNGRKVILFATTDAMSGIDFYDVFLDNIQVARTIGSYSYENTDKSTFFMVRAYDKAGNITESALLINPVAEKDSLNFGIIVIVIITILIIVLFIVLRHRSKDEDKPNPE